jgi:hypothetical protein
MVEDKKDLNETSAALLPEVELIKGKISRENDEIE